MVSFLPVSLFTVFADYFGLGAILPLIPFWVSDRGIEPDFIGYIVAAQTVAQFIGAVTWGKACDHYPVKTILMTTMVGDVLFFGLTGLVDNVWLLLVMRVLSGFSSPYTPSQTLISTESIDTELEKNLGAHVLVSMIGYFIGAGVVSVITGTVEEQMVDGKYSLHLIIASAVSAAVSVVGVLLVYTGEYSVRTSVSEASEVNVGIGTILSGITPLKSMVMEFFTGSLIGTASTLVPLVLIDVYGFTEVWWGATLFVVLGVNLFYIVFAHKKLCERFGAEKIVYVGITTNVLGSVSLYMGSIGYHFILVCVALLGMIIGVPQILSHTRAEAAKYMYSTSPANAGTVLGILRSFYIIGTFVSSMVVIPIWSQALYTPSVYIAALCILSAVVFMFHNVNQQKQRVEKSGEQP